MSTQTQYPARTVLRTVFEVILALAIVVPLVLAELGFTDIAIFGVSLLGVCAAITKVMAIPQVNDFLERFVPWLAAEPKTYRLDGGRRRRARDRRAGRGDEKGATSLWDILVIAVLVLVVVAILAILGVL